MKLYKFTPAFICLVFLNAFIIQGCGKPNIQIQKPLPPFIREYKHVRVYGGVAGMKDTGIQIQSEDAYTLMATGKIDFWPRAPSDYKWHNVRPELGWPLMLRIVDNFKLHPLGRGKNGVTLVSRESGKLYLGYKSGKVDHSGKPLKPGQYRDDRGAFDVDIIVWRGQNWARIVDLLSEIKAQEPFNKARADALENAYWYQSVYLASEKAKTEIAETEKQIAELKKEAAPKK